MNLFARIYHSWSSTDMSMTMLGVKIVILGLLALIGTVRTELNVAKSEQSDDDPILRKLVENDLLLSKRLGALEKVFERNHELEKRVEELERAAVKNHALEQRIRILEKEAERVNDLEMRIISLETENKKLKQLAASGGEKIVEGVDNNKENVVDNHRQHNSTMDHRSIRQIGGNTVAFTAIDDTHTRLHNLGPGTTITYHKTITNIGGAYHEASGIFTAPVTGVYAFSLHMMVKKDVEEYLVIMKEGNIVCFLYADAFGVEGYVSSSMTVNTPMTAGEQAWVSTAPRSWHGNGHVHESTFSGWLIGY